MINLPKLPILEKEMNRKDFLKYVGVSAMLLLGGNMIIGALSGLSKPQKTATDKNSLGYGNSNYGG